MRYLLAVLVPPLAMALCGKMFQAVVCLILMLTLIGWPVASIWALFVVNSYLDDQRAERLVRAMKERT
jgi:uncharacterized membrane protein YqaE (UPF0057 family)